MSSKRTRKAGNHKWSNHPIVEKKTSTGKEWKIVSLIDDLENTAIVKQCYVFFITDFHQILTFWIFTRNNRIMKIRTVYRRLRVPLLYKGFLPQTFSMHFSRFLLAKVYLFLHDNSL